MNKNRNESYNLSGIIAINGRNKLIKNLIKEFNKLNDDNKLKIIRLAAESAKNRLVLSNK